MLPLDSVGTLFVQWYYLCTLLFWKEFWQPLGEDTGNHLVCIQWVISPIKTPHLEGKKVFVRTHSLAA